MIQIICRVCGEKGNTVPHSMAGEHHYYGPTNHDFAPVGIEVVRVNGGYLAQYTDGSGTIAYGDSELETLEAARASVKGEK